MKLIRFSVIFLLALALWAGPSFENSARAAANTVVYITRTGERYHKDGCRYLKQSKIETTLEKAKEQGKTPCKVCKPPTE